MPRRLLSIDDVRIDGPDAQNLHIHGDAIAVAGRALPFANLEDRCIAYAFSDASVGRDMHTIAPDAWVTANFEANPVFLWAHQDDELPVGRVEGLTTEAGRLIGQVRYAEHPFAETVYQLVKGGFLNATSTGWLPLEWRAANDRKRPGGLDFTRVELLEISQVPVPALPTALVTARNAGVDTKPLYDWAERLLDQGDFAVIGKPELETLRKAARMPPKPALAPNPEPAPEPAPAAAAPAKPDLAALARVFKQRDLCTLGDLAYYLNSIEYLYDRVAAEAVREDDGSTLPAELRAWIDDGNRLLLKMAGEETQEQIDGTQDEPPSSYYWSAATLEAALARALDARGFVRKGAKYSAETLRCMRAIHGHLKKAHEQLSSLLDDAGDDADPENNEDDPDVDPDDEDSRAARIARAEALKAKLKA